MRSNPNPDSVPTGQFREAPSKPSPHPNSGYAPSVPISVYRELSAELQATKTLLDSLNCQNQQLSQQNQQLKQEIERVVQSALNLRQVAQSQPPTGWGMPPQPDAIDSVAAPQVRPPARVSRPVRDKNKPPVREEFTEQQEPRPRIQPASQKEIGGVWLVLLIGAIVITAFGAGFMVIRPLLSGNR